MRRCVPGCARARDAARSHASLRSQDLLPASAMPSRPLQGVRLGMITQTSGAGVQPGVLAVLQAAAKHAEALGAEVVPISLPSFHFGLPAYYIIAPAEASSNLARYDGLRYGALQPRATLSSTMSGTRAEGFGAEVKRRILMGTYTLSAGYIDAYYTRAQRVRALVRSEMASALATCDALLSPVAPTTPFRLGEKLAESGGREADALAMFVGDQMTVNVNLAGLPALVLPGGFAAAPEDEAEGTGATAGGLPVGVQLIGRAFGERELLRLGHVMEVTRDAMGMPAGWPSPV